MGVKEDVLEKLATLDCKEKIKANKKADSMVAEALDSRSMISYDGKEINVETNALDEERNNEEKARKAAIHNALVDVNKELGIKEKPKEQEKKEIKKEKKEEPKALA